jgi:hypothetical protein
LKEPEKALKAYNEIKENVQSSSWMVWDA